VKTVLIIKLGYCETLVKEEGFSPSLGDVFRHTVLLHHYKDYHVTWLTSSSAALLLQHNPYIDKLLIYGAFDEKNLAGTYFDEVLCLEKAETLCNIARSVNTSRHLGFGWKRNNVHAHPMARKALDVANGKKHRHTIQELLYEMVGARWQGEDYVLAPRPAPIEIHDIGLNYQVGSKWPSKAWPMANWKALDKLCKMEGWDVSWQQGCSNLNDYINWISSCRLIVTCDSLGMHLGLALKKKVIALFGPTPSEQIYMYDRGVIIRAPGACRHAPCMRSQCELKSRCMMDIQPSEVLNTIRELIPRPEWVPAGIE
jgi:heptosyltransferase-2